MKIFALGMNYAAHNKELHSTLYKPERPVVFLKPDSALLTGGRPFFVPTDLGRIDYEGELVVRICRLGKGIPARFARRYYDAVTVGVDFTARDLQARLRSEGLPWEIAKGFDGSATIGQWVELPADATLDDIHFRLDLNGKTVQQGHTRDMLYGVDEVIAYLSQWFTLRQGDLLFTGTPAGIGPVQEGDHIEGWLEDRKVLEFNCK